jgi:hypothetical protein
MNHREKVEAQKQKMTGKGLYLLKNITKADIMLPKISQDGKQIVAPGQCFRGDSYLKEQMQGSVALVEDLSHTVQTLILEQPPTVNTTGEVNHYFQTVEFPNIDGDNLLILD